MRITPYGGVSFEPVGLPYEPYLLTAETVSHLRSLFRADGLAVIGPPALDERVFRSLTSEAVTQREAASWPLYRSAKSGSLREDNTRAQLGPVARELLAAGATRALLQAITGAALVPGWSACCFTYYDQKSKYMGPHCDKEDTCTFGMLLYLSAQWPASRQPGPGIMLHVYDDATPRVLKKQITALPNRITFLYGSKLAHERPPMAEGESVSVLCGCFHSYR